MWDYLANSLCPQFHGQLGVEGALAVPRLVLLLLFRVLDVPIELQVHLESLPVEKVAEHHSREGVVRPVLKAQVPAVVQVDGEFRWQVLAQHLGRDRLLLLVYALVSLLLRSTLEALPRQAASPEVHQHVADGFEIISTTLLNAGMRVDAGVPRGARQLLVVAIWDVLLRKRVSVLLRQPEIDNEELLLIAADTHEEVLRLDVAMQKVL
mmetsp:Transcript_7527/g.21372  ORF Transcript_7527/g.21372 Transcript_7527/m.21372 type:complete len:209 (-) Transcript_7527:115-741(-)